MLHRALRGWQRQGLCWDVSGVFGSRRSDNANRRTFQPCFYGLAHTGTECLVPPDLSGLAVRNLCLEIVVVVAHRSTKKEATDTLVAKVTVEVPCPFSSWARHPNSS